MNIDTEARQSFETRGYAHLRGVLPSPILAELHAALDRLCRPEALEVGEAFFDNVDEVRGAADGAALTTFGNHQLRMNGMQRRDPIFHQLIAHEAVLPFLKQYMHAPRLAGDWHIRKDVGPRSSWWHRGTGPQGFKRTADGRRIRTQMLNVAWLLDDQMSGEGCLLVQPGSHLHEFDGLTKNNLSDEFPGLALDGSVELQGRAGDCIVFTESLFHCGDEKLRGATRRNLYMLYTDSSFDSDDTPDLATPIDPGAGPVGKLWPLLKDEEERRLCGVSRSDGVAPANIAPRL